MPKQQLSVMPGVRTSPKTLLHLILEHEENIENIAIGVLWKDVEKAPEGEVSDNVFWTRMSGGRMTFLVALIADAMIRVALGYTDGGEP